MKDSIVIGRNAVRELLRASPNRIKELFLAKNAQGIEEIEQLSSESRLQVRRVAPDKIDELAGTSSHQGVLAKAKERSQTDLQTLLEKVADQDRSVIVALDSIYDPQNLGAILRAAECFGVHGVLWSKNRGCKITPIVTKTSVGATELVDTVLVSNLADALKKLKKAGYWIVLADVGEYAQSLRDFEFPEKTVIVFGSEGEGIRPLVAKHADYTVLLPMDGQIDSLNVSQAVSVFLYASSQSQE